MSFQHLLTVIQQAANGEAEIAEVRQRILEIRTHIDKLDQHLDKISARFANAERTISSSLGAQGTAPGETVPLPMPMVRSSAPLPMPPVRSSVPLPMLPMRVSAPPPMPPELMMPPPRSNTTELQPQVEECLDKPRKPRKPKRTHVRYSKENWPRRPRNGTGQMEFIYRGAEYVSTAERLGVGTLDIQGDQKFVWLLAVEAEQVRDTVRRITAERKERRQRKARDESPPPPTTNGI
jgi:uncharacterized coiled-coil protein SlyX